MAEGDVEMNKEEPIPFAAAELYAHTMTRGAQVGGLAALVLAPAVQLYRKVPRAALVSSLATASVVGSTLGAAFLAVGTYQKLAADASGDGAYDRAYRLRYNRGQVMMDRLSYSLAATGMFVGTVVMNKGPRGLVAGFSLGLTTGALAYAGAKAAKALP